MFNGRHRPSREVFFTRMAVIDGFRLAGGLFLCRQKYMLQEYEDGLVEHCPYCWDELLKQSNNTRCPHCFGSGYADGGYKPPMIVRAHVSENSRDYLNKNDQTQGVREQQDMSIKLPFEPLFHSGDVFAEVLEMEYGQPVVLGRMFQIGGEVTYKTVQGIVSNNRIDLTMDLRERIVSQEASVKLLLTTDDKYLTSNAFWGISRNDILRNPDMTDYEPNELLMMNYVDQRHAGAWKLPEPEPPETQAFT